jgi:hypothetical protein
VRILWTTVKMGNALALETSPASQIAYRCRVVTRPSCMFVRCPADWSTWRVSTHRQLQLDLPLAFVDIDFNFTRHAPRHASLLPIFAIDRSHRLSSPLSFSSQVHVVAFKS